MLPEPEPGASASEEEAIRHKGRMALSDVSLEHASLLGVERRAERVASAAAFRRSSRGEVRKVRRSW
jgi:hypothetical protein